MSELKTVRLYGKMGTMFGRVHHLAVANPAEAIQALCVLKPGFEAYLVNAKDNGIGFNVFVGKRDLSDQELLAPTGDEDIRIAPVPMGSKKNGVGQIILGAVLVIIGVVIGVFFGWTGVGAVVAGDFIGMGIGMIVGGVVQLLTPMPKRQQDDKVNDNSYVFNGPVNTYAQGHPVPLIYGRVLTGSAVISAGIVADQLMTGGGGGGGAGTVAAKIGGGTYVRTQAL
jgi:predicted phage tail protein